MEVTVTFRHLQSNDALRSYAEEKAARIEKYVSTATEVHVILTHQKRSFVAEVIVHVNRAKIAAKEATDDNMYASIDLVMDKIERQIKKYKDKLTDHKDQHRRALHKILSAQGPEAEPTHSIVHTESVTIQTMSVDGALRHLNDHDEEFFVFRNRETDKVNVLYRRRNGDLGLIAPENT